MTTTTTQLIGSLPASHVPSRQLKIALAAWAPFVAGAEIAAERLALGLREVGHDVLMIVGTKGAAWERFRDAGLRCCHVPQCFTDKLGWLRYRHSRRQLERVLRKFQPDVVHSNDLPTSQMVSDAARRLNIPRICHHRWIFEGPAVDWLNKFDSERHLFVSQAFMNEMCGNSVKLASRPRAVVHDGLPLPPPPRSDDRRRARDNLRLPPTKTLVLFVGQIIERKGLQDLLRAWKSVAHEHADAELCVVGDDLERDGAYRRSMEALAAELSLVVRFVGFQKNVAEWFTACDIVMVPSHAEPLGLTVMEAMAHGRPVIGSRVGGIPEMLVHEETGLLVPPRSPSALAAAIKTLLREPRRRAALGFAGRSRCEAHFSLNVHVSAILEQYGIVLSEETHAV